MFSQPCPSASIWCIFWKSGNVFPERLTPITHLQREGIKIIVPVKNLILLDILLVIKHHLAQSVSCNRHNCNIQFVKRDFIKQCKVIKYNLIKQEICIFFDIFEVR